MEDLLEDVTPGTVAEFEVATVRRDGNRLFQQMQIVSLTAR